MPIINEIKFEGLTGISRSDILEAFLKDGIDLRQGGVYDAVKVKAAIQVIRKLLASEGQADAVVEVVTDQDSSMALTLKFIVVESGK